MSNNDWNQQGDWNTQDWSQPAEPSIPASPPGPGQAPGSPGGGGSPALLAMVGSMVSLLFIGGMVFFFVAAWSEYADQGPVTMAEADFGQHVAPPPREQAAVAHAAPEEACPFALTQRRLGHEQRTFRYCFESAGLEVPERMVLSLRVLPNGYPEVIGGLPDNQARTCLNRTLERLFVETHEEEECVSRFEVEL